MAKIAGSWDPEALRAVHEAIDAFAHRPAELAQRLSQLGAARPDFLPARRLQARALRHLGDQEKAKAVEVQTIRDGVQRQSFVEAQKQFLADNLEDAEVLIRRHLQSDPEDPAAALMLGEIANRTGARQEAENLFKRAIVLAPFYIEARLILAKMQRDQGRYKEALTTIDHLLELEPAHLPSLSLRAALLEQMRHFEEADRAFEELHRMYPDDARGWANHAFLLKTVGRQADAVAAYRKSLDIDQVNGLAWWGLSNLKIVKFGTDDVAAIQQALKAKHLTPEECIQLNYALGKALDDLAEYEAAFEAYSNGAKVRLEEVPYDPDKIANQVTGITKVFGREFFPRREGWGSNANDPIFIISLPRSGSTLIEQIIASHPMVEGTGELYDIERIALSLAPSGSSDSWLNVLQSLGQDQVDQLGDHYIEATRRVRRTDCPFFTDKMPSNWVYLGLIHLILPNAKVIDVRRHPLGCGFANFSQHFNWGINFSYDLKDIGRFYREYVRQLAHFEEVLPNRVHHVTYENLIENTEGEIRRMLDYLGLPFDEACLNFFENKRAVYTPSSEQVRSPINREGMERWKNYEPFLGPLKEALGDVLDHYPDVPPTMIAS